MRGHPKHSRRWAWLGLMMAPLVAMLVGVLPTGTAQAATTGFGYDPTVATVVVNQWITVQPFHLVPIPAYECPSDYPYLQNRDYAPFGTTLVPGVEINQNHPEPWPIGVYIGGHHIRDDGYVTGTTGNLDNATNWAWFDWSFQVILHCVNDPALGYKYT